MTHRAATPQLRFLLDRGDSASVQRAAPDHIWAGLVALGGAVVVIDGVCLRAGWPTICDGIRYAFTVAPAGSSTATAGLVAHLSGRWSRWDPLSRFAGLIARSPA